MKFLIYISLLLFSFFGNAQTSSKENNTLAPKEIVVNKDEKMPEYPGGPMEMMKFIQKNIKYPLQAKENGIVGQAILKFVIDSTGIVSNIRIMQSTGNTALDKEAIKVISTMDKWNPGIQNGKAVPVFFTLPINFDVEGKLSEHKKKQAELANKYYNDGVKYFGENNFVAAKENFQKTIALNYYDTDAKYNLGTVYLKLNQKDSACVLWNDLRYSFNEKETKEAEALIKKYCSN